MLPVSIPGIGVEQGETLADFVETQRSRRPLAVWADHKIEENREWKRRKGWFAEKSVQIGREHQRGIRGIQHEVLTKVIEIPPRFITSAA